MDEPVTYKVEVDPELMPELLEQAAGARLPPRVLLSRLVNDVLGRARDEHLKIVVPGQAENATAH